MGYTESSINNLDIAKGDVSRHSSINKWGEATCNIAEITDITETGGVYSPPVSNRTHQIVSTSIQDKGVFIGSYVSTTFFQTKLVDTTATFQTDGVSIGDVVLNDTNQDHSIVTAVVSETEIYVKEWHHSDNSNVGNIFRIVASAGTGASVVHIKSAYKEDGTEPKEFIILNGTTNVSTSETYYRITSAHIHGCGSNKTNIGIISATADVDNTKTFVITEGNGRTQMAFQHIPKGSVGYMMNWNSSVFGTNGDVLAHVELKSQLWGEDGITLEYAQGISTNKNGTTNFNPPKQISQGTDIWASCKNVTEDNVNVFSGFDIILIKE